MLTYEPFLISMQCVLSFTFEVYFWLMLTMGRTFVLFFERFNGQIFPGEVYDLGFSSVSRSSESRYVIFVIFFVVII